MDKTQEALKLALEALEGFEPNTFIGSDAELLCHAAITAIREALADSALDRMAENAREIGLDYGPIVERVEDSIGMGNGAWDMVEPKELAKAFHEALAEQPAQQEQEPVAYDKTEINCFAQDLYDQKMREGKRGHYESMFHVIHQCIKKVSPPASKPWVGLTDEEIEKLAVENGHATFLNDDEETGIIWFDGDATPFARAIEQKLREKNGG